MNIRLRCDVTTLANRVQYHRYFKIQSCFDELIKNLLTPYEMRVEST